MKQLFKILIGTWKGTGRGMYPTIASFNYDEEIQFEFIPEKGILYYQQKAVYKETREFIHMETGFMIPITETEFEINNAQSGGRTEVLKMQVIGTGNEYLKLLLTQKEIGNNKKGVVATVREITVNNDKLVYMHKMQTDNQPLQTHLEAELNRI